MGLLGLVFLGVIAYCVWQMYKGQNQDSAP